MSGIATLLNVFSTRLARVADQVEAASRALSSADAAESRLLARRLKRLHLRSLALDAAVLLAAVGGAATCAAVLALFVSSLREMANSWVMFGLFGLAVVSALGGVLAFTVEMLIAGTGIRDEVVQTQRAALPRMRDAAAEGRIVRFRPAVRSVPRSPAVRAEDNCMVVASPCTSAAPIRQKPRLSPYFSGIPGDICHFCLT